MISWDVLSEKLISMANLSIHARIHRLSKAPTEIQTYGQLERWIESNRNQIIWFAEDWESLGGCVEEELGLYRDFLDKWGKGSGFEDDETENERFEAFKRKTAYEGWLEEVWKRADGIRQEVEQARGEAGAAGGSGDGEKEVDNGVGPITDRTSEEWQHKGADHR